MWGRPSARNGANSSSFPLNSGRWAITELNRPEDWVLRAGSSCSLHEPIITRHEAVGRRHRKDEMGRIRHAQPPVTQSLRFATAFVQQWHWLLEAEKGQQFSLWPETA